MKRAFTLVELLIVVIILSVLAALGLGQYGRVIEKSRSSEARKILGDIRDQATAYYQMHGTMDGFDDTLAGIGAGFDQIPSGCRTSHYFSYVIDAATAGATFKVVATRCAAGGKEPQWPGNPKVQLTSVMGGAAPSDTWTTQFPYQ